MTDKYKANTIDPCSIKELECCIENFDTLKNASFEQRKDAFNNLQAALNNVINKRNKAIHDAIPDSFNNEPFEENSIKVELDIVVEMIIDKALSMSEHYITSLTI